MCTRDEDGKVTSKKIAKKWIEPREREREGEAVKEKGTERREVVGRGVVVVLLGSRRGCCCASSLPLLVRGERTTRVTEVSGGYPVITVPSREPTNQTKRDKDKQRFEPTS